MTSKLQSVSETGLAERLVGVPDRLETMSREILEWLKHLPDKSDVSLLNESITSLHLVAVYLNQAQYALNEYVNDELWSGEDSDAT